MELKVSALKRKAPGKQPQQGCPAGDSHSSCQPPACVPQFPLRGRGVMPVPSPGGALCRPLALPTRGLQPEPLLGPPPPPAAPRPAGAPPVPPAPARGGGRSGRKLPAAGAARPLAPGAAPPLRLLWTLISMTSLMDLVNSIQQTGEGGNKCVRFPKSKDFSALVPLMVCYADSNKCCFQLIDRGDLF